MAQLIDADGRIHELDEKARQPDEIRKLVGGTYRLHDLGGRYMAHQDNNTLAQNMTASRIAGRVIRGAVLILKKGSEIG